MGIDGEMPGQPGVIPDPVGLQSSTASATMPKHALQQLMATLRSPNSPEQQNQILQILKSNPQLMAAFIKQRQQQTSQLRGTGGSLGPEQPQQLQPSLQHMMNPQEPPHIAIGGEMPRQSEVIPVAIDPQSSTNRLVQERTSNNDNGDKQRQHDLTTLTQELNGVEL